MLTDLTPKVFQRLLVIVALRLCDPFGGSRHRRGWIKRMSVLEIGHGLLKVAVLAIENAAGHIERGGVREPGQAEVDDVDANGIRAMREGERSEFNVIGRFVRVCGDGRAQKFDGLRSFVVRLMNRGGKAQNAGIRGPCVEHWLECGQGIGAGPGMPLEERQVVADGCIRRPSGQELLKMNHCL